MKRGLSGAGMYRFARPRASGPAGACALLLGSPHAPTTCGSPPQTVSLRVQATAVKSTLIAAAAI